MTAMCIESSLKNVLLDLTCFDDSFENVISYQEAKFQAVWDDATHSKGSHEALLKIKDQMDESSAKLLKKRVQNTRHIEAQVDKAIRKCAQDECTAYPDRFTRMLRQHCLKFGKKMDEHGDLVSDLCTEILTFDPKKQPVAETTPAPLDVSSPTVASTATAPTPSKAKSNKNKIRKSLNTASSTSTPIAPTPTKPLQFVGGHQHPPVHPSLMTNVPSVSVGGHVHSLPHTPCAISVGGFPALESSSGYPCLSSRHTSAHGPADFLSSTARSTAAVKSEAKAVVCTNSGRWRHDPYMKF